MKKNLSRTSPLNVALFCCRCNLQVPKINVSLCQPDYESTLYTGKWQQYGSLPLHFLWGGLGRLKLFSSPTLREDHNFVQSATTN